MKMEKEYLEIMMTYEEAFALQSLLKYMIANCRDKKGEPERDSIWRKLKRVEKNLRTTIKWKEEKWLREN